MPYNFVADSFHTKKLCSRLSLSEVRFHAENGRLAVLNPLWGLWGNVRCLSYFYWKARSRFPILHLLSVRELFTDKRKKGFLGRFVILSFS